MTQNIPIEKGNIAQTEDTSASSVHQRHTCFLIGEDHLIIKCAELLIQQQFTLIGLISSFSQAKEWAEINHVPIFSSLETSEPLFLQKKIDYFFSIVNSVIIPSHILHLTQKLAINYHHSPLPNYAGINAPSWALLNNENTHGITWHVMSDMIDGGDILKQSIFNIDPHETGLSLHQKCHQQALLSFNELVLELQQNSIKHTKQSLSFRSYYGLQKKPIANGLIRWEQSGEEIERYFRALNFGIYDNTLSNLKLMIVDEFFIVSELKISHEHSNAKPGTLIEINSSFWRLSTISQDIFIIKIMTVYGKEYPLNRLVEKYGLSEGHSLNYPSNTIGHYLEYFSEKFMRYEAFWIKKRIEFEPAEMPFSHHFSHKNNQNYTLVKTLHLSNEWTNKLDVINTSNMKKSNIILTLWLIYLYRIGNKKNLGVAIHYAQLNQYAPLHHLFASELPFCIQFDDKTTFKKACHVVSKHMRNLKKNHSFVKDIFYRYQAVANISPIIPITIILDDKTHVNPNQITSSSNLLLKISNKMKSIEWYVNQDIVTEEPNVLKCIENSADHMQVLMQAAIDNPAYPIIALPLLSQHERKVILTDWNHTYTEYPKDETVLTLLEQKSVLNPHRTALEFEHSSLTYEALYSQVNQLAELLLSVYQIKQQQIVLVYLPRNAAWIISALAIMKIGAIYVPVAHNMPIHRVKLIIDDSKANLILSNQYLLDQLRHALPNLALTLDVEHRIQLFSSHTHTLSMPAFSSQLIAYSMYTSGTTGTFKAVMIKHISLVNLMYEQIRALPLDHTHRVLQFASIGFDASIWEIFATLLTGATLCIPSDKHVLIGKSLSQSINAFHITLATLPPSILQTIAPSDVQSIKTIVTAGESCSTELAKTWLEHVRLINAYGPTETTVCATMGVIQKNMSITIGKPIANTKVYVLDERFSPVPVGVIGELYIGGDSIAKGYLNQPTLTEHFFISNPLSLYHEDILYKTRDLVRWLPNGELEYIGRVDHQIKIRGLQIEPEAIETQILHHKHIAQCVVCMQDDEKLNKFIVAYLVPHQRIDLHQLRTYLSEQLPHYMIPSFFVILDKLPLTHNGKIDRKSLPKPKLKGYIYTEDYEPPKTEIEKQLCQIWMNLLGLEKVSIHQDFFTIGGNSLLLSQLIITLRDHFNFEMHFSMILKNPTISALANLVSKKFHELIEDDYHERILKDTKLPPNIIPSASITTSTHSKNQTKTVLLTGTTGFLGIHLLKDLHAIKNMKIYCLVRANSDKEAKLRIEQNIKRFGMDFSIDERIIPIAGDISKKQLSLSDDVATSLAHDIDDIYHNGASVHHLYNYERLRASNVESTLELLQLASRTKNKTIHYISTLSALCNVTDHHDRIIEEFIPFNVNMPPNDGYNQTKWVSEKLLARALARGFSINIYRSSLLLSNTIHEHSSFTNNHLLSLIKGCIQMKHAPSWNIELDILPVDFFSDIIVKIATLNRFNNRVFNFSNTHRIKWTTIIEFLNEFGFSVQLISPEKWTQLLADMKHHSPIFNLFPLYEKKGNREDIHLKIKPSVHHHATESLDFFNKQYPMINKTVLSGFFHFLKNSDMKNNE